VLGSQTAPELGVTWTKEISAGSRVESSPSVAEAARNCSIFSGWRAKPQSHFSCCSRGVRAVSRGVMVTIGYPIFVRST
jgi:hypothetical protein